MKGLLSKISNGARAHQADTILVVGVILISLLSFAMGYIVARTYDKPPLEFEEFKIISKQYP